MRTDTLSFPPKCKQRTLNLTISYETNRGAIEIHSHICTETQCWHKKKKKKSNLFFLIAIRSFSWSRDCRGRANNFLSADGRCKQSRKKPNKNNECETKSLQTYFICWVLALIKLLPPPPPPCQVLSVTVGTWCDTFSSKSPRIYRTRRLIGISFTPMKLEVSHKRLN